MKRVIFLAAVLGLVSFSFNLFVFADYSLSVVPVEGAGSLYFGRVGSAGVVNKELRIRVTSDVGAGYRITQRLLDALCDEQGNRLSSQAVKFQSLYGSNSSGTLYQETPDVLDTFSRTLYTSAPSGAGDSFLMVYSADAALMNLSGNFSGRILFTLTPLSGSGSEQQVILNVYLTSEGSYSLEVETSSLGSRRLSLSSKDDGALEGWVSMKLGAVGAPYDIYQDLVEPLRSDTGQVLDAGAVKFSVTASAGQSDYSALTPLSGRNVVIYGSDNGGSAGQVVVNYAVDKDTLSGLASGEYRGRMEYAIRSKGTTLDVVKMEIVLEVKPVFEIEIGSEARAGLIFTNIKPDSPAAEKEIIIRVKSNMGKPYTVVQRVDNLLANEKGDLVPEGCFSVRVTADDKQAGEILVNASVPVKQGDEPIFSSDAKGSAVEFKAVYSLKGASGIRAGDYSANIGYYLVEK